MKRFCFKGNKSVPNICEIAVEEKVSVVCLLKNMNEKQDPKGKKKKDLLLPGTPLD